MGSPAVPTDRCDSHFFDVAGMHGIAPYNLKPIAQVYWRFPIYAALVFLVGRFGSLRLRSRRLMAYAVAYGSNTGHLLI